jgi:hypothetical protein
MGYRAAPNKSSKYHQGKYKLINEEKYLGDPTVIYFRSKWEYNLYLYLDRNERVLKWNCEGITITYEIMENNHYTTKRYYPDCYAKILNNDGSVNEYVIEIKPYSETIPPKEPKKFTIKANENYEYRLKTFQKNLLKWKYAKSFCDKRGINFVVLTEQYFKDKNIKLF